ncbi:cytochrome c oxidase subunit I [Nesterenkonia lutea]|uniref:cytochrome-c oxidase n=1 Tax=Nesterenkonia lutea TaxID=272919 RepID=A0ABR9JBZ3_9MICC|nr:cytochrome c oxidase subunit I [Nesterenkonia lutea]MBE1523449.1 cytochrome c oxidase subunit I+III [Nesterenkonia lutea]
MAHETAVMDERVYDAHPRLKGVFTSVQHKVVGQRYMVTAFIFFLVGGLEALLLRTQLAQSDNDFLSAESYNELFTMHGTTMMFLFAIPFLEGLGTYLLPLQVGARDMPFPRYNAFNYWCYLGGGILLYSSFLVGMVPDTGWFAYVPLSGPEFADKSMDIWLFGLTLAEIAAVGAAIEIIVAVLKTRAPGMSLEKMPVFAWTMLSVAVLIIVAFVPLIVASVLLELDRTVGTAFFDPDAGGDPLLWQHLFWIFGHPEVYVMFLPGAAIISHVIPVHANQRLAAYPFVVVAVITTAIMSLGLWVHHMYVTGLPPLTLTFFTAASMSISLASGIQIFAWIATLWLGRPRFTVPMMFALAFIVTFVAGGITGVMVASAAFDSQVHDSYFVVAHFHYVIIGGLLFPIFAALYHWWPKFTGRMANPVAGHVSFWLIFLGFHITFFPMHLAGLWGMPRRVYTYDTYMGVEVVNLLSTIGAFVLALGVLIFTAALVYAWRRGPQAPRDPWGGDTLEWATDSPPSSSNWPTIPVVTDRHPQWSSGEPMSRSQRAMHEAFDRQPATFRATPLTSVLSAEPQGTLRLAEPTYWPAVPAAGILVIVLSLLTEVYWISAVGAAVMVAGFIGWSYRVETDNNETETAPIGGFPVEARGSRAIGWWAAWCAVAVLLVGVATIVLSALFLQVNSGSWTTQTLDAPVLTLGVGVAAGAGFAATRWGAARCVPEEHTATGARGTHLTAALASTIAGVIALVLLGAIWFGAGLDPTVHAYNSSVMLLLAIQALAVLFALGATVAAVIARLRQTRDLRPALVLQNASIMWLAVLLGWAMSWAATDLMPRVVI